MANEEASDAPVFSLQRVYVKDLSFENPNSPEVFERSGKQPKVEMSLTVANRKVKDDFWEVVIKVTAVTRDADHDELLFEIEVEHAGLFYMKNIPQEHIPMVLAVDCPTIIFPYTRQIISQSTVDGGFMPFILDPVNFRALFESQRQKAEAAAETKSTIQ